MMGLLSGVRGAVGEAPTDDLHGGLQLGQLIGGQISAVLFPASAVVQGGAGVVGLVEGVFAVEIGGLRSVCHRIDPIRTLRRIGLAFGIVDRKELIMDGYKCMIKWR